MRPVVLLFLFLHVIHRYTSMRRMNDTHTTSSQPPDETLTLLRHHIRMAEALADQLAAQQHELRDSVSASSPTSVRHAAKTPGELEEVLSRSDDAIRAAAVEIIDAASALDDVGRPIPEHSRRGRPPTYVRLAKRGRTFAYVGVRRDHLRIDLRISIDQASGLRAEVRERRVQADNPWKVSIYVRDRQDAEPAIEALRHAHQLLEPGAI